MPRPAVLKDLIKISKRYASNSCKSKLTACEIVKICQKCLANNYCPFPMVINKGRGAHLYDLDGKVYLDFFSGFTSVLLGHGHPKMTKALSEQASQLTQASPSYYTRPLAEYAEYITDLFCYDKVLPMNTGAEATETAVKLARKWGYRVKGIPSNLAKVLFIENSYWGSSIAAISSATDPKVYRQYGPYAPGFDTVAFSDLFSLECKIRDPNVCAFIVEPVQCEPGVLIPEPCYLKRVRELCNLHKVLMIADETVCGLGRAGCMLCSDIYRVTPDVLILGEALSGGVMPISAVLANGDVMDVIEPGTHDSPFGGNPLSCKVALTTLQIIQEEKLVENSRQMGEYFRGCLADLPKDIVCEMRGIGLLNAIALKPGIDNFIVGVDMVRNGLLVKVGRENTIQLCPPLVVKDKDIVKACQIIRHCLENSRGSCGGVDPACPSPDKPKNKLTSLLKPLKC